MRNLSFASLSGNRRAFRRTLIRAVVGGIFDTGAEVNPFASFYARNSLLHDALQDIYGTGVYAFGNKWILGAR